MSIDSIGAKEVGTGGILKAIGSAVGGILIPIVLAVVFFVLVTPIGLVYRLVSKDPMKRRFDNSESYRLPNEKSAAKNLEKQY